MNVFFIVQYYNRFIFGPLRHFDYILANSNRCLEKNVITGNTMTYTDDIFSELNIVWIQMKLPGENISTPVPLTETKTAI